VPLDRHQHLVSLAEYTVAFSMRLGEQVHDVGHRRPRDLTPGWILSATLLYCSISDIAARARR
jgi:hypothetical protein